MNPTFSCMYSISSPECWKLQLKAFQFQNFLGEHALRPHRKGGVMWELLVDTVSRSPSKLMEPPSPVQARRVNRFPSRLITIINNY